MKKIKILKYMFFLLFILFLNTIIYANKSKVTIKGHYKKPPSYEHEDTIILKGIQSGEYLEIIIEGTIYDFKHYEIIDFDQSTLLKNVGNLTNQKIIITTYLPEGVPSEKITWIDSSGNLQEYIFYENGMGENKWIYEDVQQNFSFEQLDHYWNSLKNRYSSKEINDKFNLPIFTPIGWSHDGYFAYFEKYIMPRRGGDVIKFSIINTVTDELMFNKIYDSFKIKVDPEEYINGTEKTNLNRILSNYGIIPDKNFKIIHFPYTVKNLEYSADLKLKLQNSAIYPEVKVLNSYSIDIIRSDSKKKTIINQNISPRQGNKPTDLLILGAIKSPFEDRIAVLYSFDHYYPDWGATLFTNISGCNLTHGFK